MLKTGFFLPLSKWLKISTKGQGRKLPGGWQRVQISEEGLEPIYGQLNFVRRNGPGDEGFNKKSGSIDKENILKSTSFFMKTSYN